MKEKLQYFKKLTIAYVDDDSFNTSNLKSILDNFFYKVYIFNTPKDFLESFKINNFDVLLFDICMPEFTGIDLIKMIRKDNSKTPIVLITAFSSEEYLLESINLNVQAYITKPINYEKLSHAFDNIHEYLLLTSSYCININGFIFDKNKSILTKENIKTVLNKKEKDLLQLLFTNKNKLVSYEEIENIVWSRYEETMTQNALRTLVKTLRKKLENTTMIKNLSGMGYILNYDEN